MIKFLSKAIFSFQSPLKLALSRTYGHLTIKQHICFSDKKNETGDQDESIINISKQQIEKMKQLLSNKQAEEDDQTAGQDFFQGEQAKLSLKLIQIDSIEHLRPLISQYSHKPTPQQDSNKFKEALSCKFLILFKYLNLQGSLQSHQIQQIFADITHNLSHLDEHLLTVFFRLIASSQDSIDSFSKLSSRVVFIEGPSHSNSQLMSLLLMLYKDQKEDIFKHYYLSFKKKQPNYRQGIDEPQKDIIYDPINLMHIVSHYYYYEDIHKLLDITMRVKSVQDKDCFVQESIRTEQDLTRRKVEALLFAFNEDLDAIYTKYLTKEYFDFNRLQIREAVSLLRSIAALQKISSESVAVLKECSHQLLSNILNKTASLITDDETQLSQNDDYKSIGQFIANFMRKRHQFLHKEVMIQLIRSVFEPNASWRVKFDEFSTEELFKLIVSYKASKDYLKAQKEEELDTKNIIFPQMLISFNESILAPNDITQKQLFYVCLFARQFSSLQYLKNKVILSEMKSFAKKKQLSQTAQEQLSHIVGQLQSLY